MCCVFLKSGCRNSHIYDKRARFVDLDIDFTLMVIASPEGICDFH